MPYNLRECKLQNSQFVQYRLEYNSLRNYDQQKLQSKITLSVSRYPDRTFSERLRKYRLIAELKQSELTRKLGVDDMTICNWEMGRRVPCKKHRKKVSELLKVS